MKQLVNKLSKLNKSSTFLSIKSYKNNFSEIADYSIVFNISYENALRKSIKILESTKTKSNIEALAKQELIDAYAQSLLKMKNSGEESLGEAYEKVYDENNSAITGIKKHRGSGDLHLYGLVVHKKILIPGNYSVKNKRELTIIKDKLRKNLPINNFRQFIISKDRMDQISVHGIDLL